MTFRGETNSPLEGIVTFHLINDNISMMRKETKKKTQGLIRYQRAHSKFYPIKLSLLKVVMTEEKYFQRVVLG